MAIPLVSGTLTVLRKVPAFELCYRTVRETQADDATHMAAGVAYYAILCLFPLILGIMAIFSPLLQSQDTLDQVLEFAEAYLPGASDALSANLELAAGVRGAQGLISLVGLFWTASALFGAVSRAVNRAWDIHQDRPFYIAKVRHIIMALATGILFFSSVSVTSMAQFSGAIDLPLVGEIEVADAAVFLARVLPFVFSCGIFILIYKFVPNTPTYWRYILPGAVLTAFVFEVVKSLFIFYVAEFADYGRLYGTLGSIVALQVWVFVCALILIIGAEFTSEFGRMARGVERGRTIASARAAG